MTHCGRAVNAEEENDLTCIGRSTSLLAYFYHDVCHENTHLRFRIMGLNAVLEASQNRPRPCVHSSHGLRGG